MRLTKRIAWSIAGMIAAAGLASGALAQEKVTARLDFTPAGPHAGLHLGVAKGWFKDAGLDVDVQDGRGSVNTVQLVGAGQIDFGWAALGVMAIARESGMKVKSVAGVFRKGDLAIIVDAKSNIRTAKDLKGKKLVVFAGSTWAPFIDPFFKNAGMTRNDVNIIFVDPTAMFANYASGQSDGVMTLGPFGIPIVNINRESRQVLAADYGIAFPSHGIVVREEMIASRPQTVQRFVSTVLRSWEYILAGKEGEGADSVIAARPGIKLNRDVLIGQITMYKDFIQTDNTKGRPLGWQSDRDWVETINTMESAGAIKSGKKPDEYFTNQFIKQ